MMMWLVLQPPIASPQYTFRNINENHGLSSNECVCLIKDRQEFVWIGTRNGLNRFDGSECVRFLNDPLDSTTLSDNFIKSLYEDHQGRIWVGTRTGGLNVLNPAAFAFRTYRHNDNDPSSIANDFINFTFEDRKGRFWVSCFSNGICLYDSIRRSFTNFNPVTQIEGLIPRLGADILCFAMDPYDDDKLWFGSQQGILLFDAGDTTWSHFMLNAENTENPELISANEQIMRTLLFTGNGLLWAGTWGGGLLRFNRESGTYRIYKYEPMHPVNGIRNNIKKLYRKDKHHMWAVIPNKGVAVFDIRSGVFDFIHNLENAGDPVPGPYDLVIDSLGFMYIASLSGGLYYTNMKSHQFAKQVVPYNLTDIELSADGSRLYGACFRLPGVLMISDLTANRREYFNYKPVRDIGENLFVKIERSGSRIWLVENNSLYFWDSLSSGVKPYRVFNPEAYPRQADHPHYFISSTVDHLGRIWLGTKYSGLFLVDPATGRNRHFYESDTASGNDRFEDWIFSLFRDSRNRIWYGSDNFGYFDPETERFVNFDSRRDMKDCPVRIKKISAFAETPDGYIWAGTEVEGIAVLDADVIPPVLVAVYNKKNGLPDNHIIDMTADLHGNIWVVSSSGLTKIDPGSGSVGTFDAFSGITGITVIKLNEDGEIFLGGRGGFYSFDPRYAEPFTCSVRPYIKSFRVFDEVINLDTALARSGVVALRYFQDFISFEYGAVDYFQPEQLRFFHMLEGFENNWHDAGNRKYISYTNLEGGKYTFRLKTNKGGEVRIPLRISTPFWKTGWFYLILALTVIALFLAVHLNRLRQIRREEELRAGFNRKISQLEVSALRAQMNPHFLFNSLNSIRYYILKNQNHDASEYITKFSRLLRLILRNSRQNQISLSDELHALQIYIEFEQMRFSRSFDAVIHVEEGIDTSKVMIQPMILQPFVENAIWHGLMPRESGRMLKVNISRNGSHLKIVIEDNGIGRTRSAKLKSGGENEARSFGLQITRERMSMMKSLVGKGSEFRITDLYDEQEQPAGTRVEIDYEI